jgi:hypothetical protein
MIFGVATESACNFCWLFFEKGTLLFIPVILNISIMFNRQIFFRAFIGQNPAPSSYNTQHAENFKN